MDGLINVSVCPNADPVSVGFGLLWPGEPADAARGFPVCRATVTYPAQGYAAVFGWTQLVCSTDSASGGFEMDLDWQARSFLCISPDAVITRRVRAVAGFS